VRKEAERRATRGRHHMKRRLYTVAAYGPGVIVHLVLRFALAGESAATPARGRACCVRRSDRRRPGRAVRAASDPIIWPACIVASSLLGEYLANIIVVLMLAGGNGVEEFASCGASTTHPDETCADDRASPARRGSKTSRSINCGDELSVPHGVPVDGEVMEGHGSMDGHTHGRTVPCKGPARPVSTQSARSSARFGRHASPPTRGARASCASCRS
jgi:hypothetical protein